MANTNDPNYYYNQQQPTYGWEDAGQGDGVSFNMDTNFGQEQSFQTFHYPQSPPTGSADPSAAGMYSQMPPSYDTSYMNAPQSSYMGQFLNPSAPSYQPTSATTGFEDEPPLLEELGINPDHIMQKTLAVLNPFRQTDANILQDTDLAGPLAFALAFGGVLLFSGKLHFNYIYGIGMVGCLAIYALLNLMAVSGVSIGVTVSVLGYCLLPMVGLSAISPFISLQGFFGVILTIITILWCSLSASKLFVTALAMDHQQPLVAYPCALLYGVFALLTTF